MFLLIKNGKYCFFHYELIERIKIFNKTLYQMGLDFNSKIIYFFYILL